MQRKRNVLLAYALFCHLLILALYQRRSIASTLYGKFPRFLLGFLLTGVLASTLVGEASQPLVVEANFVVSEWFAAFGFVSIGADLYVSYKNFSAGDKTILLIYLYLFTQSIDLVLTLLSALVFFKWV
jgi:hypothetical protein